MKKIFLLILVVTLLSSELLLSQNHKELTIKVFCTVSDKTIVYDVIDTVYRNSITADNIDIEYHPGSGYYAVKEQKPTYWIIQDSIFKGLKENFHPGYYDTTYQHLNFGLVKASKYPGIVSINQSGAENWGGVEVVGENNKKITVGNRTYKVPVGPAIINIEGEKGMLCKIIFPDSIIIKKKTDKNSSMKVKYLTPSIKIFRIEESGKLTFTLGGLLYINANQKPGNYQGEFKLQIIYLEPVIKYID